MVRQRRVRFALLGNAQLKCLEDRERNHLGIGKLREGDERRPTVQTFGHAVRQLRRQSGLTHAAGTCERHDPRAFSMEDCQKAFALFLPAMQRPCARRKRWREQSPRRRRRVRIRRGKCSVVRNGGSRGSLRRRDRESPDPGLDNRTRGTRRRAVELFCQDLCETLVVPKCSSRLLHSDVESQYLCVEILVQQVRIDRTERILQRRSGIFGLDAQRDHLLQRRMEERFEIALFAENPVVVERGQQATLIESDRLRPVDHPVSGLGCTLGAADSRFELRHIGIDDGGLDLDRVARCEQEGVRGHARAAPTACAANSARHADWSALPPGRCRTTGDR